MDKVIIRIVIKGCSGYGPVDEAYEDKITLTTNSIKYEYVPHPMSNSETNVHRKWNYSTGSPIFSELYHRIALMMPEILFREDVPWCTDIGGIEFIITFEDKKKVAKTYWMPGDYFKDCFYLIRMMIPKTEYMPAVLLMSEDFEDEDEENEVTPNEI